MFKYSTLCVFTVQCTVHIQRSFSNVMVIKLKHIAGAVAASCYQQLRRINIADFLR